MASAPETENTRMRNRGLLTKADREILRGEREVENPEQRLSDIRYNLHERMEKIEEDLQILRESDEDEIVAEFHDRFARSAVLENRIDELEEKLDSDD